MDDSKQGLLFRVGDSEFERQSLLQNYGNHFVPEDETNYASIQVDPREEEKKKPARPRLLSLDVFRGIAIWSMILVDNQGDTDYAIKPLAESDWIGFSYADCVFPFFLFIMGVAIPIANQNVWTKNPTTSSRVKMWLRVLRRALTLAAIQIFINLLASNPWDYKTWTRFRIPGVLVRTGYCYGVVTALYLIATYINHVFQTKVGLIFQRLVVYGLFVCAYIGIMYGVPVPNCVPATGNMTSACNAAGWFDQKVFGKWCIRPTDPEGLVSNLTSMVTVQLGFELGLIYVMLKNTENAHLQIIGSWMHVSGLSLFFGFVFMFWMPLIKKIWTLPFSLLTGGFGAAVLMFCYWTFDVWQSSLSPYLRKVVMPLVWVGMNSIVVYVGMLLLEVILMDNIQWTTSSGSTQTAWNWLFYYCFQTWISDYYIASLLFSLVHLVLWVAVAGLMYYKGIFISV